MTSDYEAEGSSVCCKCGEERKWKESKRKYDKERQESSRAWGEKGWKRWKKKKEWKKEADFQDSKERRLSRVVRWQDQRWKTYRWFNSAVLDHFTILQYNMCTTWPTIISKGSLSDVSLTWMCLCASSLHPPLHSPHPEFQSLALTVGCHPVHRCLFLSWLPPPPPPPPPVCCVGQSGLVAAQTWSCLTSAAAGPKAQKHKDTSKKNSSLFDSLI